MTIMTVMTILTILAIMLPHFASCKRYITTPDLNMDGWTHMLHEDDIHMIYFPIYKTETHHGTN